MKKYQITISNNRTLIGVFYNKKYELLYEKIWSTNEGLVKVDDKTLYRLISTNIFNTNFKLINIEGIPVYETHLLWNGSMQIISHNSKFILKQNHFLKNDFIVLNEKNEIIIKLSIKTSMNKIKAFNFDVNDANIENLELLFFVIANGTLFYLNLKRITL